MDAGMHVTSGTADTQLIGGADAEMNLTRAG
jgi:hypothetical protein